MIYTLERCRYLINSTLSLVFHMNKIYFQVLSNSYDNNAQVDHVYLSHVLHIM